MIPVDKWEIWLARVYFEDKPEEFKERPVVVYDDRAFVCTSFKVTSQVKNDRYHMKIQKWKEAGLSKQSWIDTGKVLSVPEDCFIRKLGSLDQEDILTLMRRL